MPGDLLTTGSTVQCPHGGSVTLTTSNTSVMGSDGPVLLESDIHLVSGCSFTIGPNPSPCLRIEWKAPGEETSVGGAKPLVESSVGICYGPSGAPQGTAMVGSTQKDASSQ